MEQKFVFKCDLCGNNYQFGPHYYEGYDVPRYGISVCENCFAGNHDGWAPHYEEKLLRCLEEKKLPIPQRNEKGRLPRD